MKNRFSTFGFSMLVAIFNNNLHNPVVITPPKNIDNKLTGTENVNPSNPNLSPIYKSHQNQ